jgi:hypothetical protein
MREVLTKGGTARPRATAFRAIRPAASSSTGLDVLVQEVMEAMAMEPCRISEPSGSGATVFRRRRARRSRRRRARGEGIEEALLDFADGLVS